jgi:hypothetical protein
MIGQVPGIVHHCRAVFFRMDDPEVSVGRRALLTTRKCLRDKAARIADGCHKTVSDAYFEICQTYRT